MATLRLDEDLSNDLAPALRAVGHDAIHTREHGGAGLGDARQLALAIDEHRILITANLKDFLLLHDALIIGATLLCPAPLRAHPGIIAMPNPNTLPAREMAAVLDQRLRQDEPAALRNRFLRWRTQTGWEDLSVPR